MPDLHGWITQQIDVVEKRAGRWHDTECAVHNTTVIDAAVLQSATLCDCEGPAAVLRRCEADRKILVEHKPYEGSWSNWYACEGCGWDGADYCPELLTEHVNDCPTLLALAEGYGMTEEQRAGLDRPEKERPERPAGQSTVPNAIMEAYSKALTDMVMNRHLVVPRPEAKALEILAPELKKIPGYVPTAEEQP